MALHTINTFKLHAFPSGSFNHLSNDVITAALATAESKILAACRPFHTLPLNTGSYDHNSPELAVLYDAQVKIASYNLMPYIGMKPNSDEVGDVILRNQYLEIVGVDGLLDKLSQGKFILPMDADATPTVQEKRPKMFGNTARTTRVVNPSTGKEYI